MRYIILEKDMGVFVGSFERYAVFAKHDVFGFEKVISFSTEREAKEFVENYLNKSDREFCVVQINTKSEFVSVTDIILEGYGKYTHRMMDHIPMQSTAIH